MPVARRTPARWFTLAVCALVLGVGGPARAQSTADELARTHFDSGAAYMEQGDYEASLREFKAAYELSKRPEILINVGTVNERLGRLEDAVAALESYLALDPNGERSEALKLRVDNLKKRIEREKAEAARAAPPPPPAPAPSPAAPPRAAPSRLPAYVLFAVGGGLAIGSVVTGVLANHEHSTAESSCSPRCSDGALATGRALAVTSTVLTGAAVVATAVGAVIFFGGGEAPPEPGKPVAFVNASPLGVAAGTRVAF